MTYDSDQPTDQMERGERRHGGRLACRTGQVEHQHDERDRVEGVASPGHRMSCKDPPELAVAPQQVQHRISDNRELPFATASDRRTLSQG